MQRNADTKKMECNNTSGNRSRGILHVHPSLRCNLSCIHCYSSSAPELKFSVPAQTIFPLIDYLAPTRFNVLSVSGGEPFMYRDLLPLLQYAKSKGFRTQLVTNGMLFKSDYAHKCMEWLDLIAVSIDGLEEKHDFVRNQRGAFAKTLEGINILRSYDLNFGIIHAVTNGSWSQLPELAELAYQLGARLFQLHPLELSGRSLKLIPEGLSEEDFHKAFIMYHFLKEKYAQTMKVYMDCLHRDQIKEDPFACDVLPPEKITNIDSLCNAIRSLVLDEQGNLVPFSYGMHSSYNIGNILSADLCSIDSMFNQYFKDRVDQFEFLLREAYNRYTCSTEQDLVVWSEYVVNLSESIKTEKQNRKNPVLRNALR